jgi:integrase
MKTSPSLVLTPSELLDYIEYLRKNLIRIRLTCGFNHKQTIEASQELDYFIFEYQVIDVILKKTKNLHHISPHGLRHTHAVMLLESGADIKFVSERLGHTTINMAADISVHITKKYEAENILKLESYLS